MSLSKRITYSIINVLKHVNLNVGSYLPLYSSNVFTKNTLDECFTNTTAATRYKQALPTMLLAQMFIYQKKCFVTKLQFNPQNEMLKICTLRPLGLKTQQFHINNIIPWSYSDMMASSKWAQPTLPPFLDSEMVYLNKILKEVLIFENDGQWFQQTMKHPKLSLEERINERDWLDERKIL